MDIYFPESLDIKHALYVEDGHLAVPAEGHGARRLTLGHAVVEKLVMHALAGSGRPGEEQFWHAGIGLDIVRQQVFDGFVTADFQSADPSTLDGHFRRRDHEEHVDETAEPRQQALRSHAFKLGHEVVKTKAIDEQVRHLSARSARRHAAVELLVDALAFMAR